MKEEGRSLNRSNPLGTIRKVYRLIEIIDQGANDFSKTQRNDSQIVPSEAQHRQPKEGSGESADRNAQKKKDEEPGGRKREMSARKKLVGLRRAEDGPEIGPNRIKGDESQVEKADKADNDIQAQGEGNEDPDLNRHLEIVTIERA